MFSAFDGQVVAADALVGSVKTGPHLVDRRDLELAEALVEGRRDPVIDVRPFRASRIGALVRESLADAGRRTVRGRAPNHASTALGSRLSHVAYVGDDPASVEATLRTLAAGSIAGGRAADRGRGLHRSRRTRCSRRWLRWVATW